MNFLNSYLRALTQKEFHCSVLKSSRDQLQECALKKGIKKKKLKVILAMLPKIKLVKSVNRFFKPYNFCMKLKDALFSRYFRTPVRDFFLTLS